MWSVRRVSICFRRRSPKKLLFLLAVPLAGLYFLANANRSTPTLNRGTENTPTASAKLRESLNLHKWNICGFHVEDLRQSPLFPHFPDESEFIENFRTEGKQDSIGERVFGFVHPNVTGSYKFAITSDDTSELWLSINEDPAKVRLIASVYSADGAAWTTPGDYKKYPTQISREVSLETGQKYFIEALHKNGATLGHVYVMWKPPGNEKFDVISWQFLSPFYTDKDVKSPAVHALKNDEYENLPSHLKQSPPPLQNLRYYYNTSTFTHGLKGVLPTFLYSPSYIVKRNEPLRKYQGIELVLDQHSAIYPNDSVQIKAGTFLVQSSREYRPNERLSKLVAEEVVEQFMSAFKKKHKK